MAEWHACLRRALRHRQPIASLCRVYASVFKEDESKSTGINILYAIGNALIVGMTGTMRAS
jgi:hypothetical protein